MRKARDRGWNTVYTDVRQHPTSKPGTPSASDAAASSTTASSGTSTTTTACCGPHRIERATEHQPQEQAAEDESTLARSVPRPSQAISNASPTMTATIDTRKTMAAIHHCQSPRRPLPGGIPTITTKNLAAVGKCRLKAGTELTANLGQELLNPRLPVTGGARTREAREPVVLKGLPPPIPPVAESRSRYGGRRELPRELSTSLPPWSRRRAARSGVGAQARITAGHRPTPDADVINL